MTSPTTKPIEDSIARVNEDFAVGENLSFQRKWWRFERFIWGLLTIILILDLLGAFGRGYLAKEEMKTKDGSITVKYERIERFKTPSILTIESSPSAIQNGQLHIWTSDSLVKELGAQRIIPQPAASVLTDDGIAYTFNASPVSDSVEFALEPSKIGVHHLAIRIPGSEELKLTVAVVP